MQTITIIATMRLVLDHWGVTLFSNHRHSGQFIGKWFVTLLLITFQKYWYSGKCVHIMPSILFTFHLAWVNERFFKWLNNIPNVIYGLIKIWPATNKQRIETQTCLRLQSQIDNECIMITRLYPIDKQNFIFSLSNKNRYHHEAR